MGHGQTISCLLAKKIYVPKDKSLDKQRGRSRRSEGLGEWNGQTFYAFCLIKIATARGAAAGTADSGARKAAAGAGAGAVAFAGTAFFQLNWRCI